MVLNSIENLLEKYENGETSLKEEQQLKHYFAQETVAPHLEMYRPMFAYFLVNQQEQFTKDVPLKTKRKFNYKWISVAAVAVLMFSVFNLVDLNTTKGLNQLSEEELLAYNQTMEVLNLISSKFDKGQSNMAAFNLMNNKLSEGTEQFNYVSEFSAATNKIFKIN